MELNAPIAEDSLQPQRVLSVAVNFVKERLPSDFRPELALVLGSGLSEISQNVRSALIIPYQQIPGFAASKISGHKGELILGELAGRKVMVYSGRFHFYEGHSMLQVTLPVRLAARLGTKTAILTSAVGAVNRKYRVGDLVIMKDHINFMGVNPLRGEHEPSFGERFVDLSECYSRALQKMALAIARKNRIRVQSGNYFALSGPSYETPAEIRAFRKLGADVVGMSMVAETIAARQMGLQVLGICYVSNMGAGVFQTVLNHKEVLQIGHLAAKNLSLLIGEAVPKV